MAMPIEVVDEKMASAPEGKTATEASVVLAQRQPT
jgi:hypothetical protein